jgi:hypothetical protein
MSTFSLEQVIIYGTVIFRRFKFISHHDLNPFHTLQSFIIVTEIVYRCDKEGFICYVVSHLH